MISTAFSFVSILVGDSTMKTSLCCCSEAEPALSDLFSDGQASKDWPSAMHDHMSISFNIPLTRWPPLSVVLYKHFAGFSPSVLLPTNEWASIFSRARRQSRLIMHRGFPGCESRRRPCTRRCFFPLNPVKKYVTSLLPMTNKALFRWFAAAKDACSATCFHWIL